MSPSAHIPQTKHEDATGVPLLPPGVLRTFMLVSGLFFLWGIPNNLNDVLIRQFMKSFAITRFQAGLVQSAFYLGYFVMALPAGIIMRKRGYKAGFITGLLLFACGCILFLPAAYVGRYGFFLTALFVLASGLSFLETAANPFIAQFGPTATSERRLNIAQAFNPLGAIAGVLVGTRFIFSGVELSPQQIDTMQTAGTYTAYLHHETLRVVTPYLVIAAIVLVWAVMIATTRFPAFLTQREHSAESSGNWRALLHEPHFLLSLPAQFFYVGAQVGTWSYFIQYAQEYAHTPERTAGLLLTGTLGAFGLGRASSAYLMRRFLPSRLMAFYAGANIALLAVGIFHPGWTGLLSILATSFFMSVMFPTIFALGLKDLGPNTNIAGSLLVMTIIGGGILTPLMGWVAESHHSTALAYQVPLYAYVAVMVFSLYMTSYTRKRATMSTFEI
jgi:MFS transporter, FHS family, L-fucose permease